MKLTLIISLIFPLALSLAQQKAPADAAGGVKASSGSLPGLKLRSLGPAVASGRIESFAVNPRNRAHYFVGVAAGGVWKTVNAGVTWTPVFDNEGSSSIGTVVMDPSNPNIVWVGSGEGNAQDSVGYGDGIYRSGDGGKTWQNMGLKSSEHIGSIAIDPRNPDVVYVAAQGPLWGPGGDRGLFKTTDGGKTWKNTLSISENTGFASVVIDPHNPDVLLAASYQRRRHVWALLYGGPESAIYKSKDAGATWHKVTAGLPSLELGRIGLAFSPATAGMVYARVETTGWKGGVFRSTNSGDSWEKRSSTEDMAAMYYGQIILSPKEPNRLFFMGLSIQESEDGGKTFHGLNERSKHVDTHTMWIDPNDADYLLAGCDGGVYESFDRGNTWQFKANLPVTQFYRVAVDNSEPFYYVYGGTQDNNTWGGPSRTRNASGIVNSDWFITQGGDGFQSRVDPVDPNIVYSEMQYGGLVRYDRRTGERLGIQPIEGKKEERYRWNWDAPLIISPHAHTRLYFAANKLFRSDDRGNSWTTVSGDLTRRIDRDSLPVMGRAWYMWWPPDEGVKQVMPSIFGNISVLDESPKKEGLLYAGTNDGLIQVSEDGGRAWRKIESFPGVPERVFVSKIVASQHAESVVYAAFDNHKNSDFKPYLLKSQDKGATWTTIADNLPARGSVLAVAEDHINANLLFVGTKSGLFYTIDGGQNWTQLRDGLPPGEVRDLAIQKRENDLVVATFGRGICVLDDYTPLRQLKPEALQSEATLFTVRDTMLYVQAQPLGFGKGSQGDSFFTAENPPFGAVFTYYLKDSLKTKRQQRIEAQKQAGTAGDVPPDPAREQLRQEEREEPPQILLTITDAAGQPVRRVVGSTGRGLQRVNWDLRFPASGTPSEGGSGRSRPSGHLVTPGTYKVTLAKRVNGVITVLGQPQSFQVRPDTATPYATADRKALTEFQQKATRLRQALTGAAEIGNSAKESLTAIRRAVMQSTADTRLVDDVDQLEKRLDLILEELQGSGDNAPPSISGRVDRILRGHGTSTAPPTKTALDSYRIAAEGFAEELPKLRALVSVDLKALEKKVEAAGVPHTPGRIPEWQDK